MKFLLFTLSLMLLTVCALAQVDPAPLVEVITPLADAIVPPSGDELTAFLVSIGGLKGASTLSVVFVVVKGLALIFRSTLGKFAGIWRMVIINGLMAVMGVIGAKLAGAEWGASLLSGTNLALISLFGNQVIKQIAKKGEDEKKVS